MDNQQNPIDSTPQPQAPVENNQPITDTYQPPQFGGQAPVAPQQPTEANQTPQFGGGMPGAQQPNFAQQQQPPFQPPAQQAPGFYPPQGQPTYPGANPYMSPEYIDAKKKSTTALVLGIVSLVIGLFFSYFLVTAIIGIGLGVVGIVLGSQARKNLPSELSGQATAGLVMSVIGTIWNAIVFLGCILFFGALGSSSYYW